VLDGGPQPHGKRHFRGEYPHIRFLKALFLVHGQLTIIFVVSVGLFVCLFVCAEFLSAVFDPISVKLGHMLHVWVFPYAAKHRSQWP